ncbi:hypothetical protein PVAND_004903 [Polypedilum vanderplanki]|uniref:Deltamethrin resistance protein prag01 domain-containing protein n=1 Tax=Polypedilum vanderplanki TaxID=319348 RepID=A0A9J6BYM7_POLVA|nr:hypothetical protein PVAND_004903 [Polypedilum vanderplanki]
MQGVRSLRLLARNTLNIVARRNYGHGRRHKFPTMNDMPVPEGDYWALYAERQRKYNTRLALGVTMSGLGLYVLSTDKIVHFHWSPPDTYE